MSTFQLSGLASGFDWKTFVDQLMAVQHAPADRLATEKIRNSQKVTYLSDLGTKMTALETAATTLGVTGTFGQRTAVSGTSGSSWTSSAATSTAIGSYKIAVSQLATTAHRDGAINIGAALSTTTDVSATTLANLPIASAVSAGTFSVNGAKVTVALTDSLTSVFAAIATATATTANPVTAAYDPLTDKIVLTGTGEIVLGAANDTSNFLSALKLGNNGTSSVASSAALGTVKTSAALKSANLTTAITAVDALGAGTFTINGVSIAYNVNDDTLSGILTRINQSGAGVTATYDVGNDRVALTNTTTGDIGIGVSEAAGGLLGALGLTNIGDSSRTLANLPGGGAVTAGTFTVNGSTVAVASSDTLASVLAAISTATSGTVTAAYNASTDKITLTGSGVITLGGDTSNLLSVLNLGNNGTSSVTSSAALGMSAMLVHGNNAQFKLNDGATLSSLSNTLDATSHGVTGLAVTVNGLETQTIHVASDSSGMQAKISGFITAFNTVQSSIESATKVTKDSTGKVTAAILADNREIQAFGSSLRSAAFAAVSGLSGSIARLDNLGIDFTSGTNELAIKDSTKLAAALSNNSSDVEAFFSTATTGFSAVLKARIATGATQNTTQQANLNKANTSLDDQIAEIERRLEQQRTIMESAFINMEMAQSTLKSQQSALTNAFPTTTK